MSMVHYEEFDVYSENESNKIHNIANKETKKKKLFIAK